MSDSIFERFGEAIRTKRKEKQLSQEALSEKVEISKRHLADIEKGKVNVSLEIATRLVKELGMSMDRIIYGTTLDDSEQLIREIRIHYPTYSEKDRDILYTLLQFIDYKAKK